MAVSSDLINAIAILYLTHYWFLFKVSPSFSNGQNFWAYMPSSQQPL